VDELIELIVTKLGPRERRNYFPSDLSPLFDRLHAHEDFEQHVVATHAANFFAEFVDLEERERDLVMTVFANGCPGDMPENMHLHLEKIRRWLGIEPADISGVLKRMTPFGFEYELRESGEDEPGESPEDKLLALRWLDLAVPESPDDPPPDEELVMTVVVELVHLLTEDRCNECYRGVIERCDFSSLGPLDHSDATA
jgi:hypothetical protein